MEQTIQKIPLSKSSSPPSVTNPLLAEESINSFFSTLFRSERENPDCFKLISVLLERCCQENKMEKLYPVLSNIAQHANEKVMATRFENPFMQSIH